MTGGYKFWRKSLACVLLTALFTVVLRFSEMLLVRPSPPLELLPLASGVAYTLEAVHQPSPQCPARFIGFADDHCTRGPTLGVNQTTSVTLTPASESGANSTFFIRFSCGRYLSYAGPGCADMHVDSWHRVGVNQAFRFSVVGKEKANNVAGWSIEAVGRPQCLHRFVSFDPNCGITQMSLSSTVAVFRLIQQEHHEHNSIQETSADATTPPAKATAAPQSRSSIAPEANSNYSYYKQNGTWHRKLKLPPPPPLQTDYRMSNHSEMPTLTLKPSAAPTWAPKLKPLRLTHITKTGGSSIANLGRKAGYYWGQFSAAYRKGAYHPYKKCAICQKQGSHHVALTMLPKELVQKYDWFMIVRNPFDRVLSEYHCKWGGRGNYIRKTFGNAGMPRTPRNLATMNKYIRMKIRRKPTTGAHYTAQHMYFDDRVVMNILRFETLKADFDILMERYSIRWPGGMPLKLPLKKGNTRPVSSDPVTAADLDLETVQLIQKEYAKDFRIFGYSDSRPTASSSRRLLCEC